MKKNENVVPFLLANKEEEEREVWAFSNEEPELEVEIEDTCVNKLDTLLHCESALEIFRNNIGIKIYIKILIAI